jgi:hypothetical protein
MKTVRRRLCLQYIFVVASLMASGTAEGEEIDTPPINQDARTLKEFADHVQAYAKLHQEQEALLPVLEPTGEQREIVTHQRALASKIRAARAKAKEGDIFTSPTRQQFLRLSRAAFRGSAGQNARMTLNQGEPVKFLRVRVNDTYPEGVPMTTVPPTLLINLPRLPEEVEYRIIDRDLILLVVKANLIVDFIRKAIP